MYEDTKGYRDTNNTYRDEESPYFKVLRRIMGNEKNVERNKSEAWRAGTRTEQRQLIPLHQSLGRKRLKGEKGVKLASQEVAQIIGIE